MMSAVNTAHSVAAIE